MTKTEFLHKIYNYVLLTEHELRMAGYWLSSFLASKWTKTKSRSIKAQKTKKNMAYIQPSWPNKLGQ